jgi:hypothetical protein
VLESIHVWNDNSGLRAEPAPNVVHVKQFDSISFNLRNIIWYKDCSIYIS